MDAVTTYRPPRPAGSVEVGTFTITTRGGKVYLLDRWPGADPGMTPAEARAIAAALTAAAGRAERAARRKTERRAGP